MKWTKRLSFIQNKSCRSEIKDLIDNHGQFVPCFHLFIQTFLYSYNNCLVRPLPEGGPFMFWIGSSSSSSSSVQAENCSVGCLAPKEGPTTFACKSQECLRQDWYIYIYISISILIMAGLHQLSGHVQVLFLPSPCIVLHATWYSHIQVSFQTN